MGSRSSPNQPRANGTLDGKRKRGAYRAPVPRRQSLASGYLYSTARIVFPLQPTSARMALLNFFRGRRRSGGAKPATPLIGAGSNYLASHLSLESSCYWSVERISQY